MLKRDIKRFLKNWKKSNKEIHFAKYYFARKAFRNMFYNDSWIQYDDIKGKKSQSVFLG